MQTIKDEMIIFDYDGVVDEHRNRLLIKAITAQAETIKAKRLKGVLVSMRKAIYDSDHELVVIMIRELDRMSQKVGIAFGLVDYSMTAFRLLKTLTKSTQIKLFKNSSAARLFLDPKAFKKSLKILVFDEDDQNSKRLFSELSKFGYTVTRAEDLRQLQVLTRDKHFDMTVTQSALNRDHERKKGTLSLSKRLIANLPLFMDTAAETLVSFTGLEAEKKAHTIKPFKIDEENGIICSVMHFKGDLEGTFVLVFPKDIAMIAMESLLGESVEEDDMESIMDGVGEFCNTITGSTKTALSGKDIKVLFDLPRTYTSLEATLKDIGDSNGVWIDMQLADRPFYMFITK